MSEIERAMKYLDMIPDELRGNPNNLVQLLAAMVAKVEELERVNENHCKAHLMSIDKIDELTAALKDIYKVTNDMQVMSIVMANLPQPKTIPAALKENE